MREDAHVLVIAHEMPNIGLSCLTRTRRHQVARASRRPLGTGLLLAGTVAMGGENCRAVHPRIRRSPVPVDRTDR